MGCWAEIFKHSNHLGFEHIFAQLAQGWTLALRALAYLFSE
jgi:hypothetical protein